MYIILQFDISQFPWYILESDKFSWFKSDYIAISKFGSTFNNSISKIFHTSNTIFQKNTPC